MFMHLPLSYLKCETLGRMTTKKHEILPPMPEQRPFFLVVHNEMGIAISDATELMEVSPAYRTHESLNSIGTPLR